MDNLPEFRRQLRIEADQLVAENMQRLQRVIALKALELLVLGTPVDTGRARGNWQVSLGAPKNGVLAGVEDGRTRIARGGAVISRVEPFQTIWITNNVEYIEFLEGRDGKFSPQAPRGILAPAVEELERIFATVDEVPIT